MKKMLAHPYVCMYYKCMKTVEVHASSILTPQKMGSLAGSYQYSLNPYAGCAFRCSYCYVPKFPSRRQHDFMDWGKWLEVKINAPELIRKERARVFGSSIFFSSATDPYQYAELKYRLSRKCLTELLTYQPARLTLHTRSHLILQDLDLLSRFDRRGLKVGGSITTDDESIREKFEPGAPSIARRLEVLKALHERGIRVHASIAPLLPCNPERLADLISPYVSQIWLDTMGHKEVNTRKELLEHHKDFFEEDGERRTREIILSRFSNLSRPSSNHQTAKRTNSGKKPGNVRSRQLQLLNQGL